MSKNKKVSILIISTLALILAVGLVAFAPFDNASAANLISDLPSRRAADIERDNPHHRRLPTRKEVSP
ncbi:MAG TPA: hypothetical protein DEH25_04955 [Chloroflexi bacterium]|nr:hypothetical protein [Chloroflexota bacterium]